MRFLVGRFGRAVDERLHAQLHGRGTKAAVQRPRLGEDGGDGRGKAWRQALDRQHAAAVGAHREGHARVHGPPVEKHGARSALASAAGILGSVQSLAAQQLHEGGAGLRFCAQGASVHAQLEPARGEVGQRAHAPLGGSRTQRLALGALARAGLMERAAEGAQGEDADEMALVVGPRHGVAAQGSQKGRLLGRSYERFLVGRGALDLRLRVEEAGRAPVEAGEGDPRARALLARKGQRHRHGHESRRRGQERGPLEGGAIGRARNEDPLHEAAAPEVVFGLAQEAQGGALAGLVGMSDDEHRVQGEKSRGQLGGLGAKHRLAGEGRHAADHARRRVRLAGRGQQAGGAGPGRLGVDGVLQGDAGPELEVAVLRGDGREVQGLKIEEGGHRPRCGEDPRAAAHRHCALCGQGQRLFDPSGPVVAADAVSTHDGPGILR